MSVSQSNTVYYAIRLYVTLYDKPVKQVYMTIVATTSFRDLIHIHSCYHDWKLKGSRCV